MRRAPTALLFFLLIRAPSAYGQAAGVALDTVRIPMTDGVRLAADLWRPTTPGRYPVLLEYLPYRKDESRADRYPLYAWFVKRGYIVARVDIRGTGNSEGQLIPHEYSDIELRDGDAVIDWLARQPGTTGAVGMFGISWGGFNALMMARRRPPALRAIIALHATEELYQEDVHFMDGMMHVDSWEMSQDLSNILPGAPSYTINRQYFADRFDQPPWFLTYKRQQRDGPFWDRASLRTDYTALATPTLLIGGWYDGYRDAVPRLLTRLQAPVKAIIGPWSHVFPHRANPGPSIEWRHEALRWFDRWLKDVPNGAEHDPPLRVFVRNYHPPGPELPTTPGFWRSETAWPVAGSTTRTLFPTPQGSLDEVPISGERTLPYRPATGIEAGGPVMWFGDVTPDLAPGDASALNFDTEPLSNPLEVLGFIKARLEVAASAPLAHWMVRVSDVAPDGRVTMVAAAGQNGAHRHSARTPEALTPGARFALDIELHATSWIFPAGHRIRFSVTNAQWPMIWPTPYTMTTSLVTGARTSITLPVIPPDHRRPAPEWAPIDTTTDSWPGYQWLDEGTTSGFGEIDRVERDTRTGRVRVIASSSSARRLPWGVEESSERITHETFERSPANSSVHGEYRTVVRLKGRTLRWDVDVRVRSDQRNFYYTHTRRLWQGRKLIRTKRWHATIPRDFQ